MQRRGDGSLGAPLAVTRQRGTPWGDGLRLLRPDRERAQHAAAIADEDAAVEALEAPVVAVGWRGRRLRREDAGELTGERETVDVA